MKLKSITGGLLAAAGLVLANPASADFSLFGDYSAGPPGSNVAYDADVLRATVDCANCETVFSNLVDDLDTPPVIPGASDADGFSATSGDVFVNTFGGNPADETDFLNAVLDELGSPDDVTGGTQISAGGGDLDFCSSSEYILLKIGSLPNYGIIHNTTGGNQCYSYEGVGQGSGLSHLVVFGGSTSVSEPSMLALFGLGLVVLGFLRRRTIV